MNFRTEQKHINRYRKAGKSADWIASWLKGWRQWDGKK